jgi:hypothetical protein
MNNEMLFICTINTQRYTKQECECESESESGGRLNLGFIDAEQLHLEDVFLVGVDGDPVALRTNATWREPKGGNHRVTISLV